MTAEEVLKYIQLVSRKSFIICHSGNDWKPEYEIEMKQIDQELALLRRSGKQISFGEALHRAC